VVIRSYFGLKISVKRIETSVLQEQFIFESVIKIQVVIQVNTSSDSTASVQNTSSSRFYGYIIKCERIYCIKIRLTQGVRIDINSVPNHRGLRGCGSSKRRR